MSKSTSERNNIRTLRKARGWSLAKLAELADTSPQQLDRLEKGERRLHKDMIFKLAEALHCSTAELIDDLEVETIPLVGYVGAGAVVNAIDDNIKGQGLEPLPMPILKRTDIPANEILAVRVKGDSMLPVISDGWTIYYRTKHCIEDCLRALCVVKVRDGSEYVKVLTKGSKPGLFTLTSYNASPIEDVELEWAYKIISIEPR